LQTILALAEYGSFIAAASSLKTSQPAVTRTVKHVEEVLGIKLFDRNTRSVQITAAGKEFAASPPGC
jgi:DNA-binding transcriptional LysR family regulator